MNNLSTYIMSRISNALAAWYTLLFSIPALIAGILAVLSGAASVQLLIDSEYGPFLVGAIMAIIFALLSYRLSPYYKRHGLK
jgi:hypothetical protein